MALEPFKTAPRNAQILTVFMVLFLFLAWVSTMVTFGSSMHSLSDNGISADFYWDHIHVSGQGTSGNIAYSQSRVAQQRNAARPCARTALHSDH